MCCRALPPWKPVHSWVLLEDECLFCRIYSLFYRGQSLDICKTYDRQHFLVCTVGPVLSLGVVRAAMEDNKTSTYFPEEFQTICIITHYETDNNG